MKKLSVRLLNAAIVALVLTVMLATKSDGVIAEGSHQIELSRDNYLSSPEDLVIPTVEVKPPLDVENNLEKLDGESTVIFDEGYVIIHGSSGGDAKTLSDLLWKEYRLDIDYKKDTAKEVPKEILVGNTNRPLSQKLASAVDAAAIGENYAWGYAVEDGKLALYSTGNFGSDRIFEEIKEHFFSSDVFSAKEGVFVVRCKNIAEHSEEQAILAEAERISALKARWEKALAANSAFTLEDFGGSFTTDLSALAGKSYPAPDYYPPYGEHPRVNINTEMLDDIAAALENTAFKNTIDVIFQLADTDFDGKFPDPESLGLTYNYGDGSLLGIIEAKAFMYLITGNELYGYEAIVGVKNAMLTMVTNKDQFIDPFRAYGLLMMIAAETYDWCNDLMTESDKEQFLAGIEHKVCLWDPSNGIYNMEIGFPPTLLNGTNGHGTSVMLMRDYLSFAAAVYDDYPEWWNFIAGRFYAEFTADFDFFFQSGMIHQGTSCYAPNKLYTYLWSCWIIKTLGGELPFRNDIDRVCLSLLGHMMPNGCLFETGDGTASGYGTTGGISYQCCLLSAALFKNEVLAFYGHKYSNSYKNFTYSVGSNQWTPVMSIIFLANGVEFDDDSGDQMPLAQYNGYPLGQLIVRNEWGRNAAAVFMKIGELNAGNHDHKDSGTFQIYYKGLLSGTSGSYDGDNYGNDHWKYYLQATVSKNGLLVFDPAKSASEPKFDSGGKLTNAPTFLYTGSQRTGIDYDIVTKQTAVSYGYTQDGASLEYAYIAGELSGAYDSATVKYMERNMMTVYTGDEDFPMFFFVYDNIISTSESHVKKFLLHTTKEPTLSDENGDGVPETVTTVNGEGKLVLTSLLGNDEMTAIGGEGHAFEINGYNVTSYDKATQAWNTNDYYDKNWGRVEICTSGSLESELLNVIYVTDAVTTEKLTPTLIENEQIAGALLNNIVAVFTKGVDNASSELTFSAPKTDEILTYHVAGLKAGTWKVYLDDEYLGTAYSTESETMIRFKAPAGKLTLKPGSDILPANAGSIRFETGGGELPKGSKDFYVYDVDTPLPEGVTRGDDVFLGWYLDPEFTEPISFISGDTRGPITVYAKFRATLYKADYDDQTNGLNTWSHNSEGATITPNATSTSLASMGDSCATFSFSIASLKKTAPILSSNCRLSVTNSTKLTLFTTTSDGKVLMRDGTVIADISTPREFAVINIVADFATSEFKVYNERGELTHTVPMALDGAEFKRNLTEQIFNWRANSAGTLLIDFIEVTEGNKFELSLPTDSCAHTDRNDNGICDRCGTEFSDGCFHIDLDDDEVCDKCDDPFGDGCDSHRDSDDDAKCDKCGLSFVDGCDFHRDADDNKGCDKCGEPFDDGCDTHRDINDDEKCDKCGIDFSDGCDDHRDSDDDGDCDICDIPFSDGEELGDGYYNIIYVTELGTVLSEGAPDRYESGKALPITATAQNSDFVFVGWYFDASLTTPATEIAADSVGTVFLYPKWAIGVYFNNFSEPVSGSFNYPYDASNVNNGAITVGGFWIGEKVSARVESNKDGTLLFQTVANASNTTGAGPNMSCTSTTPSKILAMENDKVITYLLRIKKATDDPATEADESKLMPITLRIGDSAVAKGINSSTGWLNVLSTSSSGEVKIGSEKIATVGTDITEIRVAVDFKNGCISAYNEDGELVSVSFKAPSSDAYKNAGIYTTEDWLGIMQNQLFQIRTMGAGTIIYDQIIVYSGFALGLSSNE